MFLFGTGFKDLDLAKYTNEKERLPLSYMKLIYRLVINIFGLWICSEPIHVLCLKYTSQKRE